MPIDRRTLLVGAASWTAVKTADSAVPGTPSPQVEMPTERVVGFGGFFFQCQDPTKLAEWYQVHLGIDPVPTAFGQQVWQQEAGPTAFAPFPVDTGYFGPHHVWMLNFRVRNLDAMVAQLQKANLEVKVDPKKYPNGRFARLHDPEGNPIELWEPA